MGGTTFKITKFMGEAPKLSSENLPESVAQAAYNVKLYSGDLIPYRKAATAATLTKTGTIKTIFPLTNVADSTLRWLHWTADVDAAVGQIENDTTQRTYYSGDSEPKATNYALATSGTDYPTQWYSLGLPTPAAAVTATAPGFAQLSVSSYARDSGNIVTIVLTAAHGLYTGSYVTFSGFTDATDPVGSRATDLNVTNVQVTVINSTTVTFFNYGSVITPPVTSVKATVGRCDLAGLTYPRTYVYTWYSAWAEESTPSAASSTVFVKEGQTVYLTALPTVMPTTGLGYAGATYQTAGMKLRVYRSIPSTSGTNYFYLSSVTMGPQTITYTRATTVITVTLAAHGLKVGQAVTLAVSSGSATAGAYTVITAATDTFTLTDAASGTTSGSGTISITGYVDNLDVTSLSTSLTSTNYDPPPSTIHGSNGTLSGMLAIHNGMMVGFYGNTVCFSEPGQPHAWPIKYRKQVDSTIVAIGNVGTTVVVATTGKPWLLQGNSPAFMNATKTDYVLPCTSKRSLVNMGYGVVYSSPGGLAMYSIGSGGTKVTEHVHSWDTWQSYLDYNSMIGTFYQDKYYGVSGSKAFIFERNQQMGGHLVESDTVFTAARYVSSSDAFYYVQDHTVYRWDDPSQPLGALDWKSKTFVLKDFANLGVARIVADYDTSGNSAQVVAANAVTIAANQAKLTAGKDIGSLGTEYYGGQNMTEPLTDLQSVTAAVTFQLYANKNLVFTKTVTDSTSFRLPATYRSDTFEVRVSTNMRIRAIHVAETAAGLKLS